MNQFVQNCNKTVFMYQSNINRASFTIFNYYVTIEQTEKRSPKNVKIVNDIVNGKPEINGGCQEMLKEKAFKIQRKYSLFL